MADDPGLRKQKERLTRLLKQVEGLLGQTTTALDAMTPGDSTASGIGELERLRVRLEEAIQAYLAQNATYLEDLREHVRKIEEANRKAAMAEQGSKPTRDEARIQELSQELSRELRLQRVDAALKELLDFLSDAEFFAANATVGRKRRLRQLQTAIETALQK